MTDTKDLEARIEELEVNSTWQRETIESLSDTVTKQWQEIDRISAMQEQILNLLRQSEGQSAAPGDEPPPPHY